MSVRTVPFVPVFVGSLLLLCSLTHVISVHGGVSNVVAGINAIAGVNTYAGIPALADTSTHVVTKRCRLSWLTNSTLVYEPKCVGELRSLSQ